MKTNKYLNDVIQSLLIEINQWGELPSNSVIIEIPSITKHDYDYLKADIGYKNDFAECSFKQTRYFIVKYWIDHIFDIYKEEDIKSAIWNFQRLDSHVYYVYKSPWKALDICDDNRINKIKNYIIHVTTHLSK